ncbi:hypothetical protein CGK32_22730 [Vibrio parahaemolyticus]|uniref:phage baseplate plug family protein n=1 Tax=Vibrio parahaemolyticus TaxID=670 RepID=UPI00111ED5DB|nr:hypothetical protein [Vibrio parahaemolyticus]TOA18432.1 hypothetical protein CGK32_22730 [Vibrio parahaemolyticus]
MAQQLNISTDAAHNFPVNVNGVPLNLRIVWNSRTESWYLDVSDENSNEIELGIRLIVNQPLVVFGAGSWDLDGNFFVSPTATETEVNNEQQKLGRDNFGGDRNYQLFYVPRNEYAAFTAARVIK